VGDGVGVGKILRRSILTTTSVIMKRIYGKHSGGTNRKPIIYSQTPNVMKDSKGKPRSLIPNERGKKVWTGKVAGRIPVL